jgi:MarR family transcriptional regulator for hemolysin
MSGTANDPTFREQLEGFDPSKSALGMVFLLANQLETIGNRFLGELTCKQWFLLANLSSFFERPPTVSQVAHSMRLSHQNVKQLALKLQTKGFLTLEKDPQDRRSWRIRLTPKAYDYGNARASRDQVFLERFLEGVSPDHLQIFLSTTLKLHDNLTQMERQGLSEETGPTERNIAQ